MKKVVLILVVLLLFAGCKPSSVSSAASNTTTTVTNISTTEERTMEDRTLLTPDQLLEIAGLPQDFYDEAYLQRFIDYYEITEKKAHTWNVKRFLENFEAIENLIDVRDIFDEKPSESVPSDPAAITVIAFYENISDGIESVYYDFQSMTCYRGSNINLFFDLAQAAPQSLDRPAADTLREAVINNGVLDWVDTESHEEIDDPQAMCLAIRFQDGSLFRVSASGLLYEDGPAHYSEVRDLLLGD